MHALIVDTRPGLGECVAGLLGTAGVTATVLTDHHQAAERLRHADHRFDFILCDVAPGGPFDGWCLLKIVRVRWPALPVVLVSAGMPENFAPRARVGGAAGVLLKPFGITEVQEMLAGIYQPGRFYVPAPRLLGGRHAAHPTGPLVA